MTRGQSSKILLLWWAGISIRITVLAVPPVLPLIHHQLHMTEAEVGALTALPVFLLAVAAVPGSLLVARLGARHALLIGLGTIAIAGALRGVGMSILLLFLLTFLMGTGMAVCQPALPSLVRAWLPERIGQATAAYSNGILIGEIIPVAVTGSLLVAWLGGWGGALAVWSIPVLLTAGAVLLWTQNEPPELDRPPARWWPDWKSRNIWLLGLTLGGASAAYWGANAFVPELLKHSHHAGYITPALTSLNLGQIPSSLIVALFAGTFVARNWSLAAAGLLVIASAIGLLLLPVPLQVVDVGVLGFASASVFVLALALPPLIADPGDTHRISAAIFAIAYTCPFLGSLLGGGAWDVSGIPSMALITPIVGGVMMFAFPWRVDLSHARQQLHGGAPVPIPPEPVL